MISDLDIQRAAVLMVRQHGKPEVVAAERMFLMEECTQGAALGAHQAGDYRP
jgi:hypothetical protein